MFNKMVIPTGGGSGNNVYVETIPANTTGDYTINCGFKAKYICLAGSVTGSGGKYYPHELYYNADIDPDKYYQATGNPSGMTQYSIGSGANNPILKSITDTSVVITTPSSSSIAGLIITD